MVERYVYDVTRRLPEKDRAEVSKELSANIYDMLQDNPSEEEIKEVLYGLGAPATLAEKYRAKPRYLISPAIYDDYIRVLKWVVLTVGLVVAVIGVVVALLDALKTGDAEVPRLIRAVLANGISMGVSAAVQALVWTTIGFVIAERTGAMADKNGEIEWSVDDLPEVTPATKGKISLADSIAEMVINIVFSVAFILLCAGQLPFAFMIKDGDTVVRTIFSQSFLAVCIPLLIVILLLGVAEGIVKILVRCWTPAVCAVVLGSTLAGMGGLIYLAFRPDMFSAEFSGYLAAQSWSSMDLLRFGGVGVGNPVIAIFLAIVVAVCLIECISAVVKTVKAGR